MKLIIAPTIFQKFQKLNVGIVIVKNIDNKGSDEKIYHLLEEIESLIKLNFVSTELAKHSLISPWRAAYSEFGAKPSKYHSSVEALMKRLLKGEDIPKVNKLVDIYNYLSLKHLVPIGASDLDKVEGHIFLRTANGTEIFIPLNSTEVEHPEKGEVIYKDDRNVLCRRWNWRDCDKTKIKDSTKNVILYVEALPPLTREKLEEVCKELISLINMFCGGEAKYYILDIAAPEIEF